MKPAPFEYVRAESVAHAVQVLADAGGDGKLIAGGQSLMPMMNFRLVKPSLLVDINHIPDLDGIRQREGRLGIGALVRHRTTAADPMIARQVPVLHQAMRHVAHLTIRNRGTFCGSICHADPAAEMPVLALLLDGIIHTATPRGGRRLPAQDFFLGPLMTALEPDELVTEIEIDTLFPGTGWGFEEFARRHGDYALAAVAVTVQRRDGRAAAPRIAVMGLGDRPLRLPEAEAVLDGSAMGEAAIDATVDAVSAAIAPNTDLHASAEYRRHLAGVLAGRALRAAWARAREGLSA